MRAIVSERRGPGLSGAHLRALGIPKTQCGGLGFVLEVALARVIVGRVAL